MIAMQLLAILIIAAWSRVARPGGHAISGGIVHDVRLPILARMRMHAVPAVFILIASLLMWLWWVLPVWGVLVAAAAMVLLVFVPVRYTLTPVGIRLGWTRFRRWTEFAGVSRAPGGARLQGAAGARDMRIWLSASLGDDEFVLLLRQMITRAYKGRNIVLDYPAPTPPESPGHQAAAVDVTSRMA
jgi:hypothetical protein